ncbi:MAG: M48 family metalloprotease [Mariprofundaceae bacterium]
MSPTLSRLLNSLLLVPAAVLVAACAVNPVSKQKEFVLMSEQQELALGAEAAKLVASQMPLLADDDPLVRYVNRVGKKVAAVSDRPNLFYRFHVVDDAAINAFALPGGYIYVNRGLLVHFNSEAELAAVLGHEIGHVTARHAVQRHSKAQAYQLGVAIASIFAPGAARAASQVSDMVAMAVIQGYGREAELQSDALSLKYIQATGYDARATIRMLETLERLDRIANMEKKDAGETVQQYHGAFASHPETRSRIEATVARAVGMQKGLGYVGRQALLAAVEGYAYGDSPDQGAVIGQRFMHPKLGIQLAFPADWLLKNSNTALTAHNRKDDVYFQLTTTELQKRESAAGVLRQLFPDRRLIDVAQGRRDGFAYAHSELNVSTDSIKQARLFASVILDGPRAYVMFMWTHANAYARQRPDFTAIADSFGRFSDKQLDVPRIALHIWKKSDSWPAQAKKNGKLLGRFTAEKLAALNGMDVRQQPRPGGIVKLVK